MSVIDKIRAKAAADVKHVVLADGDRVPIIYNDTPYQIGASSPLL